MMRIIKKMCCGFKIVQLKNGKFRIKDEWNYTMRDDNGDIFEFVYLDRATAFVREQQRNIGSAVKVD